MNTKRIYLSFCLLATLLSSCEKPDNGDAVFPPIEKSHIMFVNVLSEDFQDAASFYIDEILMTPTAISFGKESEAYLEISARTHTFAAKGNGEFIIQKNIKIAPNKHYTLYLTGTRSLPEFILKEEDVSITPGLAGCYFVHMAPNLAASKLQNHYPAQPYFGWTDTDTLIVNLLRSEPIGRLTYTEHNRFSANYAEEMSPLRLRASNDKGDIPFTDNDSLRLPLVINELGAVVLFPDTTQSTGFNLLTYSKTDKL